MLITDMKKNNRKSMSKYEQLEYWYSKASSYNSAEESDVAGNADGANGPAGRAEGRVLVPGRRVRRLQG